MRNAVRLSRYAVSRILPSVTLPRGFPRLRESFSIPLLPLAPPRYPFLSLFALLSIFLSLPSSLARSHSLGLSRRIRYSRFFRGRPRDAGRPVAAFVVEFTRTTRGKSALRATKSRPTPGRFALCEPNESGRRERMPRARGGGSRRTSSGGEATATRRLSSSRDGDAKRPSRIAHKSRAGDFVKHSRRIGRLAARARARPPPPLSLSRSSRDAVTKILDLRTEPVHFTDSADR